MINLISYTAVTTYNYFLSPLGGHGGRISQILANSESVGGSWPGPMGRWALPRTAVICVTGWYLNKQHADGGHDGFVENTHLRVCSGVADKRG